MLEFQRQILKELKEEDGLLILAKGLGIRTIVATFLLAHADPRNLVLLLNTPAEEEVYIQDALAKRGATRDQFRTLKAETTSTERVRLYRQGGVLSVTSRILVVDLLNDRLPVDRVTGVVINHAHQVSATSMPAFILRLLREKNRHAFVKAFSDYPEAFAHGFAPLEKSLKALKLRRAFLWPRFHVAVTADLDRAKADVVELRQPLSESMREIQLATMDCLQGCIAELRRFHRLVDLDEVNVENALARSFDAVLKQQLDPVWHRISARTKQLTNDVTTLRRLITYLVNYDCVTFYEYLENLLTAPAAVATPGFGVGTSGARGRDNQSPWMVTDAADLLFRFARDRVYQRTDRIPDHYADQLRGLGLPPRVLPILEEQPKWRLLRETLDEIYADRVDHQNSADSDTGPDTQPGPILVMTSSPHSGVQLRSYLDDLHTRVLPGLLSTMRSVRSDQSDDIAEADEGFPNFHFKLLTGYFKRKYRMNNFSVSLNNPGPPGATSVPSSLSARPTPLSAKSTPATTTNVPPTYKRRRVRGGGNQSTGGRLASSPAAGPNSSTVPLGEADGPQSLAEFYQSSDREDAESGIAAPSSTFAPKPTSELDESNFLDHFGLLDFRETVMVQAYQGENDGSMLRELMPNFVVMYEPSLLFIRQVERFRADFPDHPLRVYFLVYAESVEEQLYLTAVRKEKDAFERLIHERSVMVIPLEADPNRPGVEDYHRELALLRNLDTRAAGGSGRLGFTTDPPRVIVDQREFRSALPSALHLEGYKLEPCTLLVGDYVLGPDVCVERKSIADLISSFASGRLYTQAEAMCQYYTTPVLLIEFEEGRSFSLQALGDLKSDIVLSDLSSKLVLLAIAFPALRLLWSASPKATAEMFHDLKRNREEPDKEVAMRLGSHSEAEVNTYHNMTPQDILRSLPGVTSHNYRYIINHVQDLAELVDLPLTRLKSLIGDVAGRRLYEFIHRKA